VASLSGLVTGWPFGGLVLFVFFLFYLLFSRPGSSLYHIFSTLMNDRALLFFKTKEL
jgi:hypothetical protein